MNANKFPTPQRFITLLLWIATTATAPLLVAADTLEKPPIVLGQGEQRLLKFNSISRYSLGGDAVRVQALPKNTPAPQSKNHPELLIIKGIHPGFSDLWVWKEDGSTEHRAVRVEKVGETEFKPALQRALSRLEEVEILYSGGGAILRGEVKTLAESSRIKALTDGFPQEVRDQTELNSALLEEGKARLEKWLKSAGYANRLRIENRNDTLFLHGSLNQAAEQTSIRKKAQAIFPLIQLEFSALPDDSPTIYFRVFLLELKKSRFHTLGLSWPSAQEAAFRVTSGGVQDLLQLDLTLQQLEGDGAVKILSNPELAVRAPGEAELFSGGELPIRSQTHFSSALTWKSFGLTLRLKVNQVTGEKIRLDIFTEVSHLDPSLTEDKTPGIQANRMKTQVDAHFGTPLLLSGLLQQGTRQQAKGLPILRQIPVLGALFGSEDYLNERSELVAILLPSPAPPPPPMAEIRRVRGTHDLIPRGLAPPPRDWISPEEERALKKSPEYPWNALESKKELQR